MQNRITVAVSTYRETYAGWVIELLKSFEYQTIEDFEVIVVVNRNKHYYEQVLSAVESETKIASRTTVVYNPWDKGISHSRNIALKHAETPYIAYTDDDAIPSPQWLEELLSAFMLNEQVVAVTGPVLCKWELDAKNHASWFPKELYWIIGCTPWKISKVRKVRNGFASNLALKREILIKSGGFNEDFGYGPRRSMAGEEPDLGIRLIRAGYCTLWNPRAVVYHRIFLKRLRTANILKRSIVEGKTKAYLSKKYGRDAIALERGYLRSIIKGFVRTSSTKSKALLLLSTAAVLSGYLRYRIKN